MKSSVRISPTGDGSKTLFSEQFRSHYHSTFGAVQESNHVFIRHGLQYFLDKFSEDRPVNILEFGFGTGLNVLLTWSACQKLKQTVQYTGVEAYPLEWPLIKNLNYPSGSEEITALELIHHAAWGSAISISQNFMLTKLKRLFAEVDFNNCFDIVYYDAFGPASQPELWEEEILSKAGDSLRKGGILVTFCAKGSFKRALRSIGLEVEALPGPPGKREMTRAIKM